MEKVKSSKYAWIVFCLFILLLVIKVVGNFLGIDLKNEFILFKLLYYGIPIILMLFHSIITLGLPKAIFLIFLASVTGTYFEYIGLRDGTFFGGLYVYKPQMSLFNVPIFVILFWAVFIYVGYSLTNSFLYWLKIKKPYIKLNNFRILPLLVLLDGYFVVAIDLFLDPIAVKSGNWTWLEGGSYFGVPWGNFFGWFLVVIIVSSIFRTYEYFISSKLKVFDRSILIIPALGYGVTALLYGPPFIGSLFMLPQVVINLFLFMKAFPSLSSPPRVTPPPPPYPN
ncbi:MAG: carotenoid biosynthesis protein [Patescibacteria group bacterium]